MILSFCVSNIIHSSIHVIFTRALRMHPSVIYSVYAAWWDLNPHISNSSYCVKCSTFNLFRQLNNYFLRVSCFPLTLLDAGEIVINRQIFSSHRSGLWWRLVSHLVSSIHFSLLHRKTTRHELLQQSSMRLKMYWYLPILLLSISLQSEKCPSSFLRPTVSSQSHGFDPMPFRHFWKLFSVSYHKPLSHLRYLPLKRLFPFIDILHQKINIFLSCIFLKQLLLHLSSAIALTAFRLVLTLPRIPLPLQTKSLWLLPPPLPTWKQRERIRSAQSLRPPCAPSEKCTRLALQGVPGRCDRGHTYWWRVHHLSLAIPLPAHLYFTRPGPCLRSAQRTQIKKRFQWILVDSNSLLSPQIFLPTPSVPLLNLISGSCADPSCCFHHLPPLHHPYGMEYNFF